MLFQWDQWNIAHIAEHDVEPYEVEDVFYSDALDIGEEFADGEMHFEIVGRSGIRILTVIYVIRGDFIRTVTAFDANEKKAKRYQGYERGRKGGKKRG